MAKYYEHVVRIAASVDKVSAFIPYLTWDLSQLFPGLLEQNKIKNACGYKPPIADCLSYFGCSELPHIGSSEIEAEGADSSKLVYQTDDGLGLQLLTKLHEVTGWTTINRAEAPGHDEQIRTTPFKNGTTTTAFEPCRPLPNPSEVPECWRKHFSLEEYRTLLLNSRHDDHHRQGIGMFQTGPDFKPPVWHCPVAIDPDDESRIYTLCVSDGY
jgi:hypothetical protein